MSEVNILERARGKIVRTLSYYDRGLDLDVVRAFYIEDGKIKYFEVTSMSDDWNKITEDAPPELIEQAELVFQLVEKKEKAVEDFVNMLRSLICPICQNKLVMLSRQNKKHKWVFAKLSIFYEKDKIYFCPKCKFTFHSYFNMANYFSYVEVYEYLRGDFVGIFRIVENLYDGWKNPFEVSKWVETRKDMLKFVQSIPVLYGAEIKVLPDKHFRGCV